MDGPPGGIEALDELLDLPHLNVLLCWVLTHFGERPMELLYREIRETERDREIKTRQERRRAGRGPCRNLRLAALSVYLDLSTAHSGFWAITTRLISNSNISEHF